MGRLFRESQSARHVPLRLGKDGVPADLSLETRITTKGHTYRVVGIERVGAVIRWMYLEDMDTGAFVDQDMYGG